MSLREIQPRFLGRPARSLVTILSELSIYLHGILLGKSPVRQIIWAGTDWIHLAKDRD
jgi:hypothetical protein